MSTLQTLTRLRDLKLGGMAAALEHQQNGYTDLMVDGAPSPHQSDTTLRWLTDRLRS